MARAVDQDELYGAPIIREFLEAASPFATALDVGAGTGRDLEIALSVQPRASLFAAESRPPAALEHVAEKIFPLDVEHDTLPFSDESVDVIIANQILEHTKELFWIVHEMTRVLRVGGHLILGVPNVASLHNRLLLLAGRHPTQHKLYSAHVRIFSRQDTENFFQICWPDGYEVVKFSGSQFYPFPRLPSRILARRFPESAVCIFWLMKKSGHYSGQFLDHPTRANLETNFFLGPHPSA